ncbi:MAG: cobalamin biosynthesis protein [Actinomycetota bacterium]|nr:cobalamin biosynthesis protein [Actinomycetota bacterium]
MGRARLGRGAHGGALAAGLALGYLADLLVGDPVRGHPVAGFGRLALAAEDLIYRPTATAGAAYAGLLVSGVTAGVAALDRATACRPGARVAISTVVTWTALGGRSLRREARAVAALTAAGDLRAARRRLPSLCSRDPEPLDEKGLVRAAIESLAENTSDAVVGPLVWGTLAGPAGIAAHRAANTLDAMVGYRTPRYRRFGTAAARLDDLLNFVPARVTSVLTSVLAPAVAGSTAHTLATIHRHGGHHPSPNAGRTEAAFAGALEVRLGDDEVSYQGRIIRRPAVGDGPPPSPSDVERAARLSALVSMTAVALAVGGCLSVRAARLALACRMGKRCSR